MGCPSPECMFKGHRVDRVDGKRLKQRWAETASQGRWMLLVQPLGPWSVSWLLLWCLWQQQDRWLQLCKVLRGALHHLSKEGSSASCLLTHWAAACRLDQAIICACARTLKAAHSGAQSVASALQLVLRCGRLHVHVPAFGADLRTPPWLVID